MRGCWLLSLPSQIIQIHRNTAHVSIQYLRIMYWSTVRDDTRGHRPTQNIRYVQTNIHTAVHKKQKLNTQKILRAKRSKPIDRRTTHIIHTHRKKNIREIKASTWLRFGEDQLNQKLIPFQKKCPHCRATSGHSRAGGVPAKTEPTTRGHGTQSIRTIITATPI